jgi:sterol 24-C-methyltransferase
MAPIALEKEDKTRDAEFNKAMHGGSSQATGGMSAMMRKDKTAQKAAVDEYFKHWDNKSAQAETLETREVRGSKPSLLNIADAMCAGSKSRICDIDSSLL